MNELIFGDCLEILSTIDHETVRLCLTDPPWNISRKSPTVIRYDGSPVSLNRGDWDYFEADEYKDFSKLWLSLVYPILVPGGSLVSFLYERNASWFIELCEEIGYSFHQFLYYIKSNPMPRYRGKSFEPAVEMAVWVIKPPINRVAMRRKELGYQPNYIKSGIPRGVVTQKPVSVLKTWVEYLSNENDLILDPFMGSGSTLVAADELGRNWVGIDNNEEMYAIASKRMKIK